MNEEIYYKVLRKSGKSLLVWGYYAIKYKLNEWVKPKIGKVFIEDSLWGAQIWAKMYRGSIIWECRARNVTSGLKNIPDVPLCLFPSRKVKKFWRELTQPTNNPISLSRGTLWADEVMLIKKVED